MTWTYTLGKRSRLPSQRVAVSKLASAGAYTATGDAISPAALGFPCGRIDTVMFSGDWKGLIPQWIPVGAKIKLYNPQSPHAHDVLFKANPAANAVTMAANSLRNASAGDLTVAGAGADGGVRNSTAGAGSEYAGTPNFTDAWIMAIGA
jgi:hypothetical protein